ncbi:hypothetical protein [Methylobacterium oryzae]|uniref:Uncharacterized protein n=1 Tax=Methylobacterium oryzae TaxID=334852 RepID=A0ABU7TRD6_9HYPH
MLYVPPELHRAMRQVALDDGRSASDVYVEAAQALVAGRGLKVEAPEIRAVAAPQGSGLAELAEAIERQGRRIEEILGRIAPSSGGARPDDGPSPAGTTAAAAVAALVGILTEAGPAGLTATQYREAVQAAGVRSGTAEVAKAVLRAAGVVRCEGRRWYICHS